MMLTLFKEIIDGPFGHLSLIIDEDENLRAVEWEDFDARCQKLLVRHYGENGFTLNLAQNDQPSTTASALIDYFAGNLSALNHIKTATGGTLFQQKVWTALRTIPHGQTLTYGDLAKQIGNPKAVRAVGLANGANPIGIVVPCHRVIGTNGKLTGYAGGVDKKRWLLEHEGAIPASLSLSV